ncbi:ABC transporter substrate-binding protein [Ignavigranum ruoffiae]|uniref:Branched-chain amino acid transport system substrate-binding protein n=1 Tax=Ignavigranum ruoffiae TaxID=89093 RepID=A0A1H9D471_9LACT|nr:ABC transporter substrate-binding protein [Ignavigranum ruoffiae]SEQ08290.1 branched-chain amino acid transport system substrate-binding protein [Ignavigranum ruoffiae]
MMCRKMFAALLPTLLLLNPLSSSVAAAEDTVKIGGNFELTGGAASYGTPMDEATQLAIELKNADGGIKGKQIEYINYDNKSDLTEATSVATRLIDQGVHAILGPAPTGDAKATIPVVSQAGLPSIFPAVTGNGVTLDSSGKVLDWIFRVCFEDQYQGKAAGAYVVDQLGAKKVAILVDQSLDYSQGLAKAFQAELEAKGGQVVAQEAYASGDTDFSAVLTSLLVQDFDVLYVPGYYTEVGLLIKQAREMGLNQIIVGGDGLASPTLVELAGAENVNDLYYTSHFSSNSDSAEVQAFLKAYQDKYGKEPDTFAALAFDAANLMMDAMERADSLDAKDIKQALEETKAFTGVTGTFDMDRDHNPIKPALMLKLTNGKVEAVEEVLVQ